MNNVVVWFEIPVKDLNRAVKFYSQVMGFELQVMEMGGAKMAMFPHVPGNASGALVEGGENTPSEKGTLIYLNAGEDLSAPLSRVAQAGGQVLLEKMSIGEHGYIAFLKDTEGNRVGIHSMN